ncbi:MAG: methyltransferase domain-containing protein, partial [Calditrichia bacterium]
MPEDLNTKIGKFYDASSRLWEETWGEHMHHGHYGDNGRLKKDDQQAQVDLIEELLTWGNIRNADKILDIGCGIGGSALYLAEKFGAQVTGITLSAYQCQRATERAAEANLSKTVLFEVADALNPPYDKGSFDLLWSLESGEHIPEKERLMQVCADMLQPGGRLLMAVWCRRSIPPPLSKNEGKLLGRLYHAYHLPPMISIQEYAELARQAGFTQIKIDDWTAAVSRFWWAVIRSALSFKNVAGIVKAGKLTINGAMA